MFDHNDLLKPKHPQADSARTLGILSLVFIAVNLFCGCGGFVSIILGILAYNKAKSIIDEFQLNASQYNLESLRMAESAKTMGLIGAIIGGIITLATIVLIALVIVTESFKNDY